MTDWIKCLEHQPDKPQVISEHDWYFEEKECLELIHEVCDLKTGEYIRSDHIKIPWPMMFRSIQRAYGTPATSAKKEGK